MVRKRLFVVVCSALCALGLSAQERLSTQENLRTRQSRLQQLPPDAKRMEALELVRKLGLPERTRYPNGTVMEVRSLSPGGMPLYYRTYNLNSAKTIATDQVWDGGGLGLDLSGAGVVVGVWDAGKVRITHQEFGGRARVMDGSEEEDDHGTHVAGTIAAAGVRPAARGMASKSTIESFDWNNDNGEIESSASSGLLISNHSYGIAQGFEYNFNKDRWEWWGDTDISESEDYKFGFYGTDARTWDQTAYENPKYLLVKSAGNDQGDGPAPGGTHYVWSNGGWVVSNDVRETDGGSDGFDCLGTGSTAKNIMVVGAVADIPEGFKQASDVELASFSSIGPTDDGRIKPDIVANGLSLNSASSGSDQSYTNKSGTSMSSPSIAGSMALLQQHYRNLYGTYMYSSQLKAAVFHSADDPGNKGPDYTYGWGLMNTARAAELISSAPADNFFYDTLRNQEVKEYIFFSRGMEDAKITIVWTDPAGQSPGVQLDPSDKILVNDLDIRLTRQVDQHVFRPWILDPGFPSRAAKTGDNSLDNVEQILLEDAMSGFYTLRLSHKMSLSGEGQAFALVVSGLDTDYIATGFNELEEANGEILLTSADFYLNDMDVQWLINPGNGEAVSLYFDYLETNDPQDEIRIYDGANASGILLASFSGSLESTDTTLVASSGQMFITFQSDEQGTDQGFKAIYCTRPPEGSFEISGEAFPCAGSQSLYFALGQEGSDYSWSNDQDWGFVSSGQNGIQLQVGGQNGTLQVQAFNRCGSGTVSELFIKPVDDVPQLLQIQGDTLPCASTLSLLRTDLREGATYEWELPFSWTGFSETDSLYYRPTAISGPISVRARNACGNGNTLTTLIRVLDVPDAPRIESDRVPPCAHTLQDFYVDALDGHSYEWSVQNDWALVGAATGDTVTVEVGDMQSFLFVTTRNKCGEKMGNRLFLTAPMPVLPRVSDGDGERGLKELQVTNAQEFESIQWYRDGEAIPGQAGRSNPLVVNLNGLYLAESVSDQGCRNLQDENEGIRISTDQLSIRAFRSNPSSIVIQKTSAGNNEFRILDLSGRVLYAGEVAEGRNERWFPYRGIFLIQFLDGEQVQHYKAFF